MDTPTLKLVRGLPALAALADAPDAPWPALFARAADLTPFAHPAWLLPWARAFAHAETLAVLFWKGSTLSGMLPLSIYQDPGSGQRQLLLLGAGTSDYQGGLFTPEITVAHVQQAVRLVREAAHWDVAHLSQVQPGSILAAALQALSTKGEVEAHPGEPCSRCPALPVSQLPRKVRADVLYFRNAATAIGKPRLRLANAGTCLQDFETLVRLHTAGWQQRGEPGVLADPHVLAHHREAVPLLHTAGLLRLYTLELAGAPTAVLYALADPPGRVQRTLYTYLIGHAPEHAAVHPGTLLTAMAMEAAAAEGIGTVDMLRGNESYKRFWRVEPVPTLSFTWQCPA